MRAWGKAVARLDPDRPPGDVPAKRWHRFIDDVGLFLASPLCAEAIALGWVALDLFGCDPDKPHARIDKVGLLWLLNGNRIVELTADAAVIETTTGARQRYRRRPTAPGSVLAWGLAQC